MTPRPPLIALTPRRAGGRIAFDGAAVGAVHLLTDLPPDPSRPPALRETPCMVMVVVVTSIPLGFEVGPDRSRALGPAPLLRPSDFVPARPTTDVLLRGASEAGRLSLRVGSHARTFAVTPAVGPVRLELHLMAEGGEEAPIRLPEPPRLSGSHRWFGASEVGRFHAAPRALRFPALDGRERIELTVSDGRALAVDLPGLAPRLRVLGASLDMPDQDVWTRLDEVEIDVDRGEARLAFRALVPALRVDGRDIDRVDVLFADPADRAAAAEPFFDPDVPRASFGPAWTVEDAERGEPPAALSDRDLQIARYATWDGSSPLPVVPLALAAQIAAELTEQQEDRAPLIARHGLTPYAWEVEERAWYEAMAEVEGPDDLEPADDEVATTDGEDDDERGAGPPRPAPAPAVATLWADAFRLAQDALARPEESLLTAPDYAVLTVALEGPRPDLALARGIGLGAYQRLDRRMQARAAAEPAFAADLEALLEAERAGARERGQDDPFPGLDLDDRETS